jgi:hypothetical protein
MLLQEFHRVQFLVHCYFIYTSMTSKAVVIYFRSYYMQMIRMLSIQICAWKLCIIQYKMNKVVKWLNANKLSINASKTKFVIFK